METYNQARKKVLSTAPQKRVDDPHGSHDDLLSVAESILGGYLREKGLKQSTKRDRVLEVFLDTREHLGLFRKLKGYCFGAALASSD